MASKLSRFLAELKRRKVYNVAAVYAAVGVAISIAVPDLFGAFGFPSWAAPLVIVVIVIGFPIALVLAWAYEVKPEEPRAGEKAPALTIDTPKSEQRKSIVVLPFDNMSPDPGDAYFTDGLTEEIITSLSHIHALRVISRNSAMVLKGTQKSTRAIAEELDVQYVLEGSVRRAGTDLRITAQLIDATSDEHVWAERYDGVLDDVFGMQEQVSRSIVDAMDLHVLPEEEQRLSERRIDDIQAYEFYLKARNEIWSTWTESSLSRALELAESGLEIVGDNDLLYAVKGMAYWQVQNGKMAPPETFESLLGKAQDCAERALRINPRSASGHTLQAYIFVNSGNPEGAVRHFAEALHLNPNDPEALHYLGYMGAAGGWDPDSTRGLLEKLALVDPLTPINRGALAWLYWFEGRFEDAIQSWGDLFSEIEGEKSLVRVFHAYLRAAGGNITEAVRIVDQMISDSPAHLVTALFASLKHGWLGEPELALDAITEDLKKGARWDDLWPLLMADAFALIDDREQAFDWLEHAIEYGTTNVRYLGEHDPFLGNLRSDARFDRLIDKAVSLSTSLSALADVESLL